MIMSDKWMLTHPCRTCPHDYGDHGYGGGGCAEECDEVFTPGPCPEECNLYHDHIEWET